MSSSADKSKVKEEKHSIRYWLSLLILAIIKCDFKTNCHFINTIEDKKWLDPEFSMILAFGILEQRLNSYAQSAYEIFFSKKFSQLIDIFNLRNQVDKIRESIPEKEIDISLLDESNEPFVINNSLLLGRPLPEREPKWKKSIKKYNETKNPEYLYAAIKTGLFEHLFSEADNLFDDDSFDKNYILRSKKFVGLIANVLNPIVYWRRILLLGGIVGNEQEKVKAKINLKKIGEVLSSPFDIGRTSKISKKNKRFKFWQTASIAFLYGEFCLTFTACKNRGDTKFYKQLKAHFKLNGLEPNAAAKKLLSKHFEVSLRTLEKVLSEKELIYILALW